MRKRTHPYPKRQVAQDPAHDPEDDAVKDADQEKGARRGPLLAERIEKTEDDTEPALNHSARDHTARPLQCLVAQRHRPDAAQDFRKDRGDGRM